MRHTAVAELLAGGCVEPGSGRDPGLGWTWQGAGAPHSMAARSRDRRGHRTTHGRPMGCALVMPVDSGTDFIIMPEKARFHAEKTWVRKLDTSMALSKCEMS